LNIRIEEDHEGQNPEQLDFQPQQKLTASSSVTTRKSGIFFQDFLDQTLTIVIKTNKDL
jgi:hypothetical protein